MPSDADRQLTSNLNTVSELLELRRREREADVIIRTLRLQRDQASSQLLSLGEAIKIYEAQSFWRRLWSVGDLLHHLKIILEL